MRNDRKKLLVRAMMVATLFTVATQTANVSALPLVVQTYNIAVQNWTSGWWDTYGPAYATWTGTYDHAFGQLYGYFEYQFTYDPIDQYVISAITLKARMSSEFWVPPVPPSGTSDVTISINGVEIWEQNVIADDGTGVIYTFTISDPLVIEGLNIQEGPIYVRFEVKQSAPKKHGLCIYGDGYGVEGEIPIIIDIEHVPLAIPVLIDIKPGSYPNSINLKSKGVVPVAVLTTQDFDAVTVDAGTVEFAGAAPLRWTWEDVDDDGDVDLLLHFRTQELNLDENSTEATLTGETLTGDEIEGTDEVRIVPRKK